MLKPYKLDIQQGNLVTSKMLLQLKPGMTKSQVRYIMGTPLIVDSFHKDRWDYFYQMRQGGKVIEQRRVILDFEKEALARVRGDVVPQGTAGAVSGEVTTGAKTTAEILKEKEEPGLLDKLQFWKDDKKPTATPAEVAKPAAVPEKSWTEKLKFWKKDETPVTKPVEVPKEMTTVPAAPESPAAEAPSEEAPSVLAVPIGVDVFTAPVTEESAPAKEEPAAVPTPEPAKPAPVVVEESKVTPPASVVVPVKPAPAPVKPVQPAASNKQDDRKIFRLDRTLKPELLDQEIAPPAPAAEPVVEKPAAEKVAKPKKKATEEPLPAETEPTFFDKMLEKIGF